MTTVKQLIAWLEKVNQDAVVKVVTVEYCGSATYGKMVNLELDEYNGNIDDYGDVIGIGET